MLTETKTRFDAAGVTGKARLFPGAGNLALIEFRWSEPGSEKVNTAHTVVTMDRGRISAMSDYSRTRAARKAAGV